jgi:hypothetical protein
MTDGFRRLESTHIFMGGTHQNLWDQLNKKYCVGTKEKIKAFVTRNDERHAITTFLSAIAKSKWGAF